MSNSVPVKRSVASDRERIERKLRTAPENKHWNKEGGDRQNPAIQISGARKLRIFRMSR